VASWQEQLRFDPLAPLLSAGNEALGYFARRDLLGEPAGPIQALWSLPGVQRILRKQLPNGAWPRPGVNQHPAINVELTEAWRQLRFLVEQYGLTREHPQVERACEFVFSCQSAAGDLRGMLANQYATYYTGAIMALLIQAGYEDDPRIEKGFHWLLGMRQEDGGWSIPLLTHKLDRTTQYRLTSEHAEPLEPDRAKPFSHNATGMVLRAFAVHPAWRQSEAALAAGRLLRGRFFQPDAYTSYHAAGYWLRFDYPFWWNHLVAALDSLSRMDFSRDDAQIGAALNWLVRHQRADGLWDVAYARAQERETGRSGEMRPWITLAICRLFHRWYGSGKS